MRIGLVGGRAETAVEIAVLAASVGAQVVPLGDDDWVAAARRGDPFDPAPPLALVVVDVAGAESIGSPSGPFLNGVRVGSGIGQSAALTVVVHRGGEQRSARELADRIGADHVLELPTGADWLADQLRKPQRSSLLAIAGAAGGVGTTSLAIACALAAAPDCLLVDADAHSAGLDLPLGIPDDLGGRWESVPDTPEPLVAESVRAALPLVAGITVLTGPLPHPLGRRLDGVVEVGRSAFEHTVIDLGRGLDAVALDATDAVVVACPATLAGVAAAGPMLSALPTERVLLAVRPSGWLPVGEVAEQLGGLPVIEVPRLARLGELADCADLLSGRTGRALDRLGKRIWAELA